MIKVALIGAGSVVFSRNLTGDILSYPEFRDATFSYMDVDTDRLEVGAGLCRKVAKGLGANPKIQATTDRREALRDADFVICMVQIGGFDSTLVDFEIPRKYDLNFTIADTTGPGGMFRALRTFPFFNGMVKDILDVAPKATLLNYSNPMSMNMQSITRSGLSRAVGLCHSVQGTFDQLMGYIGEDPHDPKLGFICGGINHMSFFTRLEKTGQDLYPRLFDAMKDPKVYKTNKVRFELMKRFGHFITESSEHNAEYSAHFIPHGPARVKEFDIPIDEYLRRCDGIVDEFERMKKVSQNDEPLKHTRSHEYGSTIIHSMVTGKPSVVYGNMPNRGAISNLPPDAIAEVPTLVDRAGLQFTTVGALPPQLIGYMMPHVIQHELFIRAAMEGRRDHIYQAAMFDPLTAATLDTDQIVDMCDELIAGHGFIKDGGVLPDLDAKKTLVATSGKVFHPPTREQLRASWDSTQKEIAADAIREWHVLGPVSYGKAEQPPVEWAPEIEHAIVSPAFSASGHIDLTKNHTHGATPLQWKKTGDVRKNGLLGLDNVLGRHLNCVAYAYAEIESIHARDCVLKVGSDDGVKLWLNGVVVHTLDTQRGYVPSDEVAVKLKSGVNRILFKLTQGGGGWGLGVVVPKANF